jgi:hypothetical protein
MGGIGGGREGGDRNVFSLSSQFSLPRARAPALPCPCCKLHQHRYRRSLRARPGPAAPCRRRAVVREFLPKCFFWCVPADSLYRTCRGLPARGRAGEDVHEHTLNLSARAAARRPRCAHASAARPPFLLTLFFDPRETRRHARLHASLPPARLPYPRPTPFPIHHAEPRPAYAQERLVSRQRGAYKVSPKARALFATD